MKPDPQWIYSNEGNESCIPCDSNKKPFKFEFLTKKKPINGTYTYVIRELEPKRIYLENRKIIYDCKTGKERILNHNCIALNRRVICAGDITFIPYSRGVTVSNASGHYLPNIDCLNYLQHLLSNLGYQVLDYYEY